MPQQSESSVPQFEFSLLCTDISWKDFGQRNSDDQKCARKAEESFDHSSIRVGGARKDEIFAGSKLTSTHLNTS